MLSKKQKYLFVVGIISIVLPLVLFGRLNKTNAYIETIQWNGDCVTLDEFKLIEIDSVDCESFPNISETMQLPFHTRFINDTVIAYSEINEFNLLRIANLNTQEVIELLPVVVDGGDSGALSTISQITLADDKIWVVDWQNYRVGAFDNDYSARFDSMQLWAMPNEFYRIVPQKGKKFARMPGFKENARVELLDSSNKISALSKKFPPVSRKGSLNNMDVQVEMDVSPDMSYFVLSTRGWDFIEIYKDGGVKMLRGPIFNETLHVQDKMGSYIRPSEEKSLTCLRVVEDGFAVGLADKRCVETPRPTVIPDIKTVLIFSKDGQPLYRLSLPNIAYEFDIDYANNELITLEDYFNPKLKRYKINTPLVINQ